MGSSVIRSPGRVLHGVRDRSGDGNRPRLAEPLRPEGPGLVNGLDQRDEDLWHVRRREELVVEEARVQHAPVPEPELLGETVAEPHVDAALDLALAPDGIQGPPDVVRGGDAHHLDLARRLLHVDQRRLRREAVRHRHVAPELLVQHLGRRVIERLPHQDPAALPEVPGPDHPLVRDPAPGRGPDVHVPVLDVERLGGLVELLGGQHEELALDVPRGQERGVARDERRPARVDPDVPGLDRRVVVHDSDPPERDPELLGDDHREDRLRPLADLAGPRDQRDLPEVVELDDRPAAVGAVHAGAASDVKHAGVADPPPPTGPERPLHGLVDVARHRVEALRQRAARDPEPLGRDVARAVRVPAPHLETVQAEPLGQVIHLRLHGEGGLEVPVAPHRARVDVVRVDDRRVEADVRTAVEAGERRHHDVRGR
jgi:hypothetical protein